VKRKIAVAAALAATLFAAACGSDSDTSGTPNANASVDGKGKTLKVWLMVDAQSGWKNVVDDATARFTAATGAQVQVDYQQWGDHLAKVDATLAGSDVPDVMELGNTEMPKYVFNGAFAELDKAQFENNDTWLKGLSAPCDFEGKTYCVPYYAGARVLIYNTDLFSKAGLQAPKTYDDVLAAADKLKAKNSGSKFSAFYAPGAYVYMGLAFVAGSNGTIAKQDGSKWTGTLSEPAAQEGLTKWADLVKKYSVGDKTKNELDQDPIFAQGQTGMIYGSSWELGAVQEQPKDPNDPASKKVKTKVNGKVAAVAMPSIPSFLGGSDLGVTAKSANPELAAQWIKIFTDTKSQEALIAKGALPNATSLLDKAAAIEGNAASAEAAKNSWFVPMAPKWADVESANVIPQMLSSIATGKATVPDAAKKADEQINTILNS
jgi:N,N'-diacetylchitobiose transport system substrate-binding protein